MNKLKKRILSFVVLITTFLLKIPDTFAKQYRYGTKLITDSIELKYGVREPTVTEKVSNMGKFIIPIILIIVGIVVILSKRIPRKIKIIIVSILPLLIILGYVLMNYIAK